MNSDFGNLHSPTLGMHINEIGINIKNCANLYKQKIKTFMSVLKKDENFHIVVDPKIVQVGVGQ